MINFYEKSPLPPLCQRGEYRMTYHYNIFLKHGLTGVPSVRASMSFKESALITVKIQEDILIHHRGAECKIMSCWLLMRIRFQNL
jgi:hypothetical protein